MRSEPAPGGADAGEALMKLHLPRTIGLAMLNAARVRWLNGLNTLFFNVPAQYPIRHYPDITHSRQCQFPVPDWDVAYALTEGRESIKIHDRETIRERGRR